MGSNGCPIVHVDVAEPDPPGALPVREPGASISGSMTLEAPATDVHESVAELQDALARIRSGKPLASDLQTLFHCAYVAGCVDTQRESMRQLASTPGFPPSIERGAEDGIVTDVDRILERGRRLNGNLRQSVLLNPAQWVPSLRHALQMNRRAALQALGIAVFLAVWYWWWLGK